jgi:hypothetical protein
VKILLQRQRSDLHESPIGSAARRTAVVPKLLRSLADTDRYNPLFRLAGLAVSACDVTPDVGGLSHQEFWNPLGREKVATARLAYGRAIHPPIGGRTTRLSMYVRAAASEIRLSSPDIAAISWAGLINMT